MSTAMRPLLIVLVLVLVATLFGCRNNSISTSERGKGSSQRTATVENPTTAAAESQLWLVRIAKSTRANDLLGIAHKLAASFPEQRIVKSDNSNFALLSGPPSGKSAAQAMLVRAADTSPKASLVECQNVRGRVCVQWTSPVVSSTFFGLDPEEKPQDEALLVRELSHNESYTIQAIPYYDPEDDSPLLGMLSLVAVVHGESSRILAKPCLDGKAVLSTAAPLVAVECVTGQAGSQLTHAVRVFELSTGHTVGKHDSCRNPKWIKPNRIQCQKEAVNAKGELSLTPLFVALTYNEKTDSKRSALQYQ